MPDETPSGGQSDRDLIAAARREAEAMLDSEARSSSGLGSLADVPNGYEVVREIHRGGQGAVYLAIQRATRRKVAIKVMHSGPALDSSGHARFEREVQVLGQLNHPNIVKIHDSGQTDGGQFYYVMDYIPGKSLDDYIKSNPEMDVRDTISLFSKICDAVNAAHVRGVIHRDLKPSNVRINPDNEPIVVDFGLAKVAVPTDESSFEMMTITGQFVGSLPWASPEQAGATPEAVDVRTDVYSLGVMLYQMLTHGKFPYDVLANMREVLDNILHAVPARPSSMERRVNDELDTIVLKCLSKDKERRYQTAGELARDLRHFLKGEPIEAKRDSGLYVISKTLRRYKPHVAVAATFLLLLIGFVIVLSVLLAEVSQQRDRAEENFRAARQLARVFMFEFHDEIAPLRGTTRAQELILDEARRYLDSIRTKGSGDPEFLLELAEANDRVGDLLSGFGTTGTGDAARAADLYEEASTIRHGLVASDPDDATLHAAVAQSSERLAWVHKLRGEFDDALSDLDAAISEYDTAIGASSNAELKTAWTDQREGVGISIAGVLVNQVLLTDDGSVTDSLITRALDELDAAARHFRRRVDVDPTSAEAQAMLAEALRQTVLAMITKGRLHNGAGDGMRTSDPSGASAEYALARSWFERAEQTSDDVRIELETVLEGDPTSARLLRYRWMATLDGADAVRWQARAMEKDAAIRDEAISADLLDEAAGLHRASLARAEQALDLAERLSIDDESNAVAFADVAVSENKVGNALLSLDRLDEADEHFNRSLQIRRSIEASDPSAFNKRRLALAEFKLGDLAIAKADADAGGQLAHLQRAEGRYLRALRLYEAISDEQRDPSDTRAVGTVQRRLDVTRARLQVLRQNG